MLISLVSGALVAEIEDNDLGEMIKAGQRVGDLKRFLAARIGHSRFCQRLLTQNREWQDDMPLTFDASNVQLVILEPCRTDLMLGHELITAAESNRLKEVEALLQQPLDPDILDSSGMWNAIHAAAIYGHLEVVRLLVEAGADKESEMDDGPNALQLAAQNGHLEVVQFLLEAGASKDAAATGDRSALHMAAQNGHARVVELLLEWAVDKDAMAAHGQTALHLASFFGHLEVVRLLAEAGSAINAVRADGETALHVAAEGGHFEVVRFLFEFAGVDKHAKLPDGRTALHIAAYNGHAEFFHLLLKFGLDLDATAAYGPALQAANRGQALVKFLEASADPSADLVAEWPSLEGH